MRRGERPQRNQERRDTFLVTATLFAAWLLITFAGFVVTMCIVALLGSR